MYLTLISPAELAMHAINHKEIITGLNTVKISQYHLFYLIVLVFLHFSYVCVVFFKKKANFQIIRLFFFFMNLAYAYVLYYDFFKLYYVAGWGTHTVHNYNTAYLNNLEYGTLITNQTEGSMNLNKIRVPSTVNNLWNDVFFEKQ